MDAREQGSPPSHRQGILYGAYIYESIKHYLSLYRYSDILSILVLVSVHERGREWDVDVCAGNGLHTISVSMLSLSCAVFPQATAGEAVGTKSRVVVVDRAALSDFTAKLNHRYNVRGRGRDESL